VAWRGHDGPSLYVLSSVPPGDRVDRLDLATGRRTPWRTLVPADRAGLVDTGFVMVSPGTGAYVYSYRRLLSTLFFVEGLR
jgi:hypothetical protein